MQFVVCICGGDDEEEVDGEMECGLVDLVGGAYFC